MKTNPGNTINEVHFDEKHKQVIVDGYNSVVVKKLHERYDYIKDHPIDIESKQYLEDFYNSGYGYKIIARCLDSTYTRIRSLLNDYLKIETRKGYDVTTDKLNKFRSDRVKGNLSPGYKGPEKNMFQAKKSETGIQGYYIQRNGESTGLRSSWEYTFVKGLDKHNVDGEPVHKSFVLNNGESYLPDFIIHQDGEMFFVEVKGTRYQHRLYKVDLFRESFKDKKIMVIDDVKPFGEHKTYKEELDEWKKVKLSKKELRRSRSKKTKMSMI